jgi:hypothetical protein
MHLVVYGAVHGHDVLHPGRVIGTVLQFMRGDGIAGHGVKMRYRRRTLLQRCRRPDHA